MRIWERVTCGFWRKMQNLPPFFLSPYGAKRENLPPLILVILQGSLFMEAVMVQRPLGGVPVPYLPLLFWSRFCIRLTRNKSCRFIIASGVRKFCRP